MKKILFVCTGNTCRSPIAEAIARSVLPAGWKDEFEFSSAGTAAWSGLPASSMAVDVLNEDGIDLSDHLSRLMTKKLGKEADLIVTMTEAQRRDILAVFPGEEGRIITLGALDGSRRDPDIEDPVGGTREIYIKSREDIKGLVYKLIDYLADRYKVAR